LKIILSTIDERLTSACHDACDEIEDVTVTTGSILDLKVDAVVSPANSFGFMDGGIDGVYRSCFGDKIELAVRRSIWQHHGGELLVGQALIVSTEHPNIPHLIAAPTMRVPMWLGDETVNPYLAVRAALRIAHATPQIESVAIPGMGTGIGGVSASNFARQTRQAILDTVDHDAQMPSSWAEASEAHQLLYGAAPRDLQRR
jgi:O-acetyl-ADP-ribose deacetylase (regulator of RNase III)